jgi:hypothetical protein
MRGGALLALTASSAIFSVVHIFSIACELVVTRGIRGAVEREEVDCLCLSACTAGEREGDDVSRLDVSGAGESDGVVVNGDVEREDVDVGRFTALAVGKSIEFGLAGEFSLSTVSTAVGVSGNSKK